MVSSLICSNCRTSDSLLFDGKAVYCTRCGTAFNIQAKKTGLFSRSHEYSGSNHNPDPEFVRSLVEEIEDLRHEIEIRDEKNLLLESGRDRDHSEVIRLQSELKKSNETISCLQSRISTLDCHLAESCKQKDEAICKYKSLFSSNEKNVGLYEAKINRLNKDLDILKQRISYLESEFNDKNKECDEHKQECELLKTKLNQFNKQISMLYSKISTLEAENKSLDMKSKSSTGSLNRLVYEKDKLTERAKTLECKLVDVQHSLEYCKSEFDDLKNKNEELVNSKTDLKRNLEWFKNRCGAFESELALLREDSDEKDIEIAKLTTDKDNLQTELIRIRDMAESSIEKATQYNILQSRFKEYKDSIQDYLSQTNDVIHGLNQQKSELEEKINAFDRDELALSISASEVEGIIIRFDSVESLFNELINSIDSLRDLISSNGIESMGDYPYDISFEQDLIKNSAFLQDLLYQLDLRQNSIRSLVEDMDELIAEGSEGINNELSERYRGLKHQYRDLEVSYDLLLNENSLQVRSIVEQLLDCISMMYASVFTEEIEDARNMSNLSIKKLAKTLKGKGIMIQYHVPGEPWEAGTDIESVNVSTNYVSDISMNRTVHHTEKIGCTFKKMEPPIPSIVEELLVNVIDDDCYES